MAQATPRGGSGALSARKSPAAPKRESVQKTPRDNANDLQTPRDTTIGTPRDLTSVDAIVATAPPLDYSFKELKQCGEIETEEPRGGGKRKPPLEKDVGTADGAAPDAVAPPASVAAVPTPAAAATGPVALPPIATVAAAAAAGGGPGAPGAAAGATPRAVGMRRVLRKVTIAVKLNNNAIETVQDLPAALDFVMDDPIRNLRWVDLSYNMIKAIEPALMQLTALKALYLHGNRITSLPSCERLKKLPQLISLTLNGNPIENNNVYRSYVIGALGMQIRSLDHSTITEEEKKEAISWFQAHLKRMKTRKEKQEEDYLNSLQD